MKNHFYGQLTVGLLVVMVLLVGSAAPSHAWRGGGWSGGGGGWHHHPSVVFSNHVFVGSRVFVGHRPCCFGPRFFFGVGVAAPLFYPYSYAYPYPYPVYLPPVVVESSPPVYVQQGPQPQYWYYCQSSQAYYPYVKECPGGWLQVVPQSSPPPQ